MRKILLIIFLLSFTFAGCEKLFLGKEPENTSLNNFNILWKTFDEYYAQFGIRHVNWDSLHTVYCEKFTDETTESQLWDLSAELISNLNDGHVCLINRTWNTSAQSSKIIRTRTPDDFSLNLVKTKFLTNPTTTGAGYITYGFIKDSNIGYIHIASFRSSGTGNGVDWAFDIDKAVRAIALSDGLIVDVRNNTGGLIATENIISSAFIDHKITYFYSRRKIGPGHDEFGELLPVSVSPRSGTTPYKKKIIFLTNRFTASGGEYMTQVFRNLPNSTQVGDTTLGAFGEITSTGELPNGWTFLYPCTLTTLPDGTSPEGKGIIPDILVTNSKTDIDERNDKVLEFAISIL